MADDASSQAAPTSILRKASSSSRQKEPGRSASFASPLRRQSTQERLNEIIETGQERADGMSRARSAQPATATNEDSADETTRIFDKRRKRGFNYQATSASRPAPHSDGQADEGRSSQLKENWNSLWSIELENKGSVARDHLAIERTFLAWLRTSLAFASIGIAVTQLFRLNTSLTDDADDPALQTIRNMGQPLGSTFLGISILVLLLGYLRFYQSQKYVITGKFPAARLTIVLVSLIACALMVICLVVVVVVHPKKPASRAEL